MSEVLGDSIDLVILNVAPPALKHQVIRYGKPIYIRDERARIVFEARSHERISGFRQSLEEV